MFFDAQNVQSGMRDEIQPKQLAHRGNYRDTRDGYDSDENNEDMPWLTDSMGTWVERWHTLISQSAKSNPLNESSAGIEILLSRMEQRTQTWRSPEHNARGVNDDPDLNKAVIKPISLPNFNRSLEPAMMVNTYRVTLDAPVGLGLRFMITYEGIVTVEGFNPIYKETSGSICGPAENSGCICIGDELVAVNQQYLCDFSFHQTAQLLRDLDQKVKREEIITLTFRYGKEEEEEEEDESRGMGKSDCTPAAVDEETHGSTRQTSLGINSPSVPLSAHLEDMFLDIFNSEGTIAAAVAEEKKWVKSEVAPESSPLSPFGVADDYLDRVPAPPTLGLESLFPFYGAWTGQQQQQQQLQNSHFSLGEVDEIRASILRQHCYPVAARTSATSSSSSAYTHTTAGTSSTSTRSATTGAAVTSSSSSSSSSSFSSSFSSSPSACAVQLAQLASQLFEWRPAVLAAQQGKFFSESNPRSTYLQVQRCALKSTVAVAAMDGYKCRQKAFSKLLVTPDDRALYQFTNHYDWNEELQQYEERARKEEAPLLGRPSPATMATASDNNKSSSSSGGGGGWNDLHVPPPCYLDLSVAQRAAVLVRLHRDASSSFATRTGTSTGTAEGIRRLFSGMKNHDNSNTTSHDMYSSSEEESAAGLGESVFVEVEGYEDDPTATTQQEDAKSSHHLTSISSSRCTNNRETTTPPPVASMASLPAFVEYGSMARRQPTQLQSSSSSSSSSSSYSSSSVKSSAVASSSSSSSSPSSLFRTSGASRSAFAGGVAAAKRKGRRRRSLPPVTQSPRNIRETKSAGDRRTSSSSIRSSGRHSTGGDSSSSSSNQCFRRNGGSMEIITAGDSGRASNNAGSTTSSSTNGYSHRSSNYPISVPYSSHLAHEIKLPMPRSPESTPTTTTTTTTNITNITDTATNNVTTVVTAGGVSPSALSPLSSGGAVIKNANNKAQQQQQSKLKLKEKEKARHVHHWVERDHPMVRQLLPGSVCAGAGRDSDAVLQRLQLLVDAQVERFAQRSSGSRSSSSSSSNSSSSKGRTTTTSSNNKSGLDMEVTVRDMVTREVLNIPPMLLTYQILYTIELIPELVLASSSHSFSSSKNRRVAFTDLLDSWALTFDPSQILPLRRRRREMIMQSRQQQPAQSTADDVTATAGTSSFMVLCDNDPQRTPRDILPFLEVVSDLLTLLVSLRVTTAAAASLSPCCALTFHRHTNPPPPTTTTATASAEEGVNKNYFSEVEGEEEEDTQNAMVRFEHVPFVLIVQPSSKMICASLLVPLSGEQLSSGNGRSIVADRQQLHRLDKEAQGYIARYSSWLNLEVCALLCVAQHCPQALQAVLNAAIQDPAYEAVFANTLQRLGSVVTIFTPYSSPYSPIETAESFVQLINEGYSEQQRGRVATAALSASTVRYSTTRAGINTSSIASGSGSGRVASAGSINNSIICRKIAKEEEEEEEETLAAGVVTNCPYRLCVTLRCLHALLAASSSSSSSSSRRRKDKSTTAVGVGVGGLFVDVAVAMYPYIQPWNVKEVIFGGSRYYMNSMDNDNNNNDDATSSSSYHSVQQLRGTIAESAWYNAAQSIYYSYLSLLLDLDPKSETMGSSHSNVNQQLANADGSPTIQQLARKNAAVVSEWLDISLHTMEQQKNQQLAGK